MGFPYYDNFKLKSLNKNPGLDAFSEYVRGPFREDVLGPLRTPGSIPFGDSVAE